MAAQADNKAVAFSEKIFERLLAAYPKAHREEYGVAMAQLFRDQGRDAWSESRGWGLARLWLRVLPDVIGTSLMEHLETIKERKFMFNRISTLFRSAQTYRFFTVFAAVFLLVVIAVTLITFLLPESFAGKARILVRKFEGPSNNNAKNTQPTAEDYDPYFVQTQFEVLQSRLILQKVVQRLGLRERWANRFNGGNWLTTRAAIDVLGRSIEFRPIRNTSVIEIRAFSDKSEEAADLANATAEAYCDYRSEKMLEMEPKYVRGMRDQLENQENELRAAQVEVDQLRQAFQVYDPEPSSTGPSAYLSMKVVQQLQTDITRSEGDAARLEKLLEKLKALPPEKLRTAIQTVVEPDSVLNTLAGELDIAEQKVSQMRSSTTEDHPDFKVAQHLVDELNIKINDRVANIMYGLQTRLDSAKANVAYLSEKLTEAKQTDIKSTERSRPYWSAKQKLAALLQFRASLQMKIASAETDLQMPKLSSVEIVERALPQFRPARPNKPMNIIVGIFLGTLLGLIAGGGMAGISFLVRRNAPPKIAS